MNFLAHLYLSGNDNEIMIGNFIADAVKGKAYQKYSLNIQQGILLHRKIDEYTDTHPITKNLKLLLKKKYNKHSGIVVDIFYDHFLCANWSHFSSVPLEKYISNCHRVILRNIWLLPSKIKAFLPILIARKRLLSYSGIDGIENALRTMSKYTSLPPASDFAIEVLKIHYSYFNMNFLDFFKDLAEFSVNELSSISEIIKTGSIKP
jgi:acyl carrier protein phosphodiesterase